MTVFKLVETINMVHTLRIERSVVNKNLTALIENGLIVLTTEQTDMRKKRVHLTLKGNALAHKLFNMEVSK